MTLTLELKTIFHEALNTSYIYPITSKVCFVKGLANYKLTYVSNIKSHMSLHIQFGRGKNIALLAKLNWRFNFEKDAIWTNVL